MTKNTKLLLAGAGIVVLFLAYKKGVFGGTKTASGNSTDAPATFDVAIPADADVQTVTATGNPQGVILPILPNTFSQMAPISEGAYA